MADNKTANAGSGGATFATDDIGGVDYPRTKITIGADGVNDGDVSSANPMPVTGPLTDTQLRASAVPVSDNGGSLTVDGTVAVSGSVAVTNAALGVTGGGVEATALRVTVASDSTGVLSVDDNGGSLTVDGTVTANAGTNLNTSLLALEAGGNLAGAATSLAIIDDWDETDRAKVNLVVGQAGVPAGNGTAATSLRVTIASDTTGVLAVTDNGGNLSIDDGGNSITVDGTVAVSGSVAVTNAALAVVGGGTEATALRVTIATDSTGVLSVDDNGGSLTVDGPLTNAELRAAPVEITGAISATSAATATEDDPAYTEAASEALSQTLTGYLRTFVAALVAETAPNYLPGETKPLSISTDGRLRVVSASEIRMIDPFFEPDEERMWGDFNTVKEEQAASPWGSFMSTT